MANQTRIGLPKSIKVINTSQK